MSKNALLLIDFEKEWVDKSSDYYVGDIPGVIERTNRLTEFCRSQGYKIIFTRHVEKDSDGAFAAGSENVEIIPRLHKKDSDVLITKNKISPFYQTKLQAELKGVSKIVVAGLLTNLCVRHTVEDAYDRDFKIIVIKDCCATFDSKTQEFTFNDLKATREEVEFVTLKEFLKR